MAMTRALGRVWQRALRGRGVQEPWRRTAVTVSRTTVYAQATQNDFRQDREKEQRSDASPRWPTAIPLLALATALLAPSFGPGLSLDAQQVTLPWDVEDVLCVCIIAPPKGSGAQVQVDRLCNELDFQSVSAGDMDKQGVARLLERLPRAQRGLPEDPDEPSDSARSTEKEYRLVVLGFPESLDQLVQFEQSIGKVFVALYFDAPWETVRERCRGEDEKTLRAEFDQYRKAIEPVVKKFRDRGNVLEISAHWPDPEEVWMQVQAKFESCIELRERHEWDY